MLDNSNFDFEKAWEQLSKNQKRYVKVRGEHPSKKKAAEAIGLSPATVYAWPDYVEKVSETLLEHEIEAGRSELRSHLIEAVQKIAETMQAADSEHAQLDAARYIADQVLGKATQSQKVEMDAKVEGISVEITGDGAEPDIE